jgi:leucyl aminopeptidase
MIKIINHTSSNQINLLKVFLVQSEEIEKHSRKELFKKHAFEAKYKQVQLMVESSELYVGLSLKSTTKNFDPFFRVNYFELGASLYKTVSKMQDLQIEIALFPSNQQDLFDFLLGFNQAEYIFDTYLKKDTSEAKTIEISFAPHLKDLISPEIIQKLEIYNQGLNQARSFVDGTPEDINPESLPRLAQTSLSSNSQVEVKTFSATELLKLGMNGIVSVGRASRYQPNLFHAIFKPTGEVQKKICLVGKGLTYDSGGLDIKTDGHMRTMKMDMAGSATMFGTFKILAELGLKNIELHWISAFAENMIDANSYKSDDILTTFSGQTVEVYNTDAEGRLTLADALAYATLQEPDYIVDAATLTGACVASLSEYYTALMSNDRDLALSLESHFQKTGEKTVLTPMPEVLREFVTGKNSDLVNTSTAPVRAGHLTAGLFLSHFVDQNLFRNPELKITEPKAFAWAHLDIAGSAYNENKNLLGYKGATGQSIRSLVSWVLSEDAE